MNYPNTIDESNYDRYLEPLYPGDNATQAASIVKLLNLSGPDYRPESQKISGRIGVPVPYYGGWTVRKMGNYLKNRHGPNFGILAYLNKPFYDVLTRISLQKPDVKLTKELIIRLLKISQLMKKTQGSFFIKRCLRLLSGTFPKYMERLPRILLELFPLNEVREIYFGSFLGRRINVSLSVLKIDPLKLDFKDQLIYIEQTASMVWLFKDKLELLGNTLDLEKTEQVLKRYYHMLQYIPQNIINTLDHRILEDILVDHFEMIQFIPQSTIDKLDVISVGDFYNFVSPATSTIDAGLNPDKTIDQTRQLSGLTKVDIHDVSVVVPQMIEKARNVILNRGDKTVKDWGKQFYEYVPSFHARKANYLRGISYIKLDPERQLADLEKLRQSNDQIYFKVETDPQVIKIITDRFNRGLQKDDKHQIAGIFKVTNPILKTKFKNRSNPSDNIVKLWHGSRKQNILSLIKNGLRLPNYSGMFGKGIYFALLSIKSMSYSDDIRSCDPGSEGWLLYNTVDMGRVYDPGTEAPHSISDSYDSLHAKASANFLHMDEVVIYDPSRVYTTHLVKVVC